MAKWNNTNISHRHSDGTAVGSCTHPVAFSMHSTRSRPRIVASEVACQGGQGNGTLWSGDAHRQQRRQLTATTDTLDQRVHNTIL